MRKLAVFNDVISSLRGGSRAGGMMALGLVCLLFATAPAVARQDGPDDLQSQLQSAIQSAAAAQLQAEAAATPARKPDEADLKALTDQVLKSLDAIASGKKDEGDAKNAAGGYQQLMEALSSLVEKATQQGKSSEDILALIEEALAGQDDATLDALIAQAGGKVELRRLLQALVRKAAMKAVEDDPYARMLQTEGNATSTAVTPGTGAVGRAPVTDEDGARVVVVQPGDTLGTIALRHYGQVGAWRKIYEANRDKLDNPDLVPAGIKLRLP